MMPTIAFIMEGHAKFQLETREKIDVIFQVHGLPEFCSVLYPQIMNPCPDPNHPGHLETKADRRFSSLPHVWNELSLSQWC